MQTIDKIDVRASTSKIERLIVRSASGKSVSGFIAHHVGFRLDDTSTYSATWKIVHEGFSDQIASEFDSVDGQCSAPKAVDSATDARVWTLPVVVRRPLSHI